MSRPLIVAHRGASAYKTDNTLSAFKLAVEQKADCIELDVHLSGDNFIVIYHDQSIAINGKLVPLNSLTLTEIRHYVSLTRQEHLDSESTVLTFDELSEWLKTTNVEIIIDIKDDPVKHANLAGKVLEKLRAGRLVERAHIVSFDHSVIFGLKEHTPTIRTGILYVAKLANLRETMRFVNVDWIESPNEFITQDVIKIAHEEGVKICSWKTNEIEEMSKLCSMGMDMITTDHPDIARDTINRYFTLQNS